MSEKLRIDEDKTAILIMDYQHDILVNVDNQRDTLLKGAANFLAAVRSRQCKIFYVCVGFRETYPEIASGNLMFDALKQNQKLIMGTPGTEIHASVKPLKNDVVIVKRRVNAFYGTDLEVNLRAAHISTLIMFGVSTGGVVLSTLRYAADQDYRCIIVKDLCADKDEEIHQCLVNKIFPRQAEVITAAQF